MSTDLEKLQTFTPFDLAYELGTNYAAISHYYYSNNIDSHYRVLKVSKATGGEREIRAPDKQLLNLQRKLLVLLEAMYKAPDAATGFIKGRGIFQNASVHRKSKFVFNLDLSDFFTTITFQRVYGLLKSPPYSLQQQTAAVIAHLSCVKGHLPQGAPTSPIISNMICRRLDRECQRLALKHYAKYSRYADDITFSFRGRRTTLPVEIVEVIGPLSNPLGASVGQSLRNIIKGNGFDINQRKTRLQSNRQRQSVTGLVVNEKVNVPRKFVRNTRALIHSARNIPPSEDEFKKIEKKARGCLEFIRTVKGIDSPVYDNLAKRFNNLNPTKRAPRRASGNRHGGNSVHTSAYQKVWALDFEGISESTELVQATAFSVSSNLAVTCLHAFRKAQEDNAELPRRCFLIRPPPLGEKVEAELIGGHDNRDIAILKLKDFSTSNYYQISEEVELTTGDRIHAYGYPERVLGTQGIYYLSASVTTFQTISTVQHIVIDKEIKQGFSGGIALDGREEPIGIVSRGTSNLGEGLNIITKISEVQKTLKEYNEAIVNGKDPLANVDVSIRPPRRTPSVSNKTDRLPTYLLDILRKAWRSIWNRD
ncbi:MAG: reverse transcriptase domain-containing protein [Pseudomonadales bacterium]